MLLAALLLGLSLSAADSPQEQGRRLYDIGRNHYMLGDYKKATQAFQAAVAAQPAESDYYRWLGRAFGRRAEQSSPFTAPVYAWKARRDSKKRLS